MQEPRILVVIPVYNHGSTLAGVVRGVLSVHPHVLVVDDGSTDLLPLGEISCGEAVEPVALGEEHPLFALPVGYLRHLQNRGKGAAVLTAAAEAKRLGMTHIITIDADGQHDPADLPLFIAAVKTDPDALVVGLRDFTTGSVPCSSRFGRAFSNFWFTVHTGQDTGDVQSGFRLYPLRLLERTCCSETRYGFETEVLVRASWAGFAVVNVPVRVNYPPRNKHISHFHPLLDNARISLLNTRLTIRAIMPVPHKKYCLDAGGHMAPLHPFKAFRRLLADNVTPKKLALSAAAGIFLGTLPLVGLHSILILLATGILKLNKVAGLAFSQLCIPPFVPALCVEAGHYMRNGRFLTEISLQTLGYEALDRLWEWILGSVLLAPALALLSFSVVYLLARGVQNGLQKQAKPDNAHPHRQRSGREFTMVKS